LPQWKILGLPLRAVHGCESVHNFLSNPDYAQIISLQRFLNSHSWNHTRP